MSDRITLPNALFQALLPQNTWTVSPPPDKTHFSLAPLCVSLSFSTSLATAGSSDDVQHTLSYSQLYKNAQSVVCDGQQSDVKQFPGGIRQVAREIAEKTWEDCPAASKKDKCTALQVTVEQPKSLLQARTLFVQHTRRSATTEETVGIKGYRIQTVIGVWKHERHQPQPMELDVYATLQPEATWKADAMLSVIDKHVEENHPALLEAYLEDLAGLMLDSLPLQQVTLEIVKPFGNIWSDPPRVRITRPTLSAAPSLPLPHPLSKDQTAIMAIINLTPDSFATEPFDFERTLKEAEVQVAAGAHILDLGAMSTRPGAEDVSASIEIERLIPFVRAIRQTPWGAHTVLSIDTFRASVAHAALEAGANWINDVQAGAHTADGDMLQVASRWDCPIVLMHMRGTPQTMSSLSTYEGGVVSTSRDELLARIGKALDAGVREENIIVDPGIGFAKDGDSNWALLRQLREWHQGGALARYPMLMGASRKRFLGALTGKEVAKDRDVATAALMVDAIRQGVTIVRVHDTVATVDAVKVADRLYR